MLVARRKPKADKRAARSATSHRKRRFRLPSISFPDLTFTRAHALRSIFAIAWVAGAASILAGWTWGVPRLREYAAAELEPTHIEIRLIDAPAWLFGATLAIDRIKAAVAHNVGLDPFDREGLLAAGRALEATGWFQSVDSVKRASPGIVEVRGSYVEPFTTIVDDSVGHLVTESGNLLPMNYPQGARLKLPAITNPRFAQPAEVGARWDGTDVAAGLRLVKLLEGRPWTHQIAEVDVSSYADDETLWLVTDKGGRILWGRAPGDERGREVPASQKLSYLDFLYKDFKRVDRDLKELVLMPDYVYAPR